MKSFREYVTEAELFEDIPAAGDVFEIEIAREEIVIETTVVGYMDDGIVIEADDKMMRILTHVGYLTEDSNMPTARDSISPIHSNVNRDKSNNDDSEKNYMDKDSGATPPGRPTHNAIDAKPLIEPKNKKNPQDYMAKEGVEDETMISAYQDQKVTDKNGKVSDEFTSRSFARNPATGSGSYMIKQQKDGAITQDEFQQNVSKPWMNYTEKGGQGPMAPFRATTNEAEYQGRKVALGKPMAGDVKKSKVYVKNAKGNVVKVNFGDPNMTIKKSNPARRKSFRARHNCANPGPRTSARYWSCRAW
jgi:hypothetical protein